MLTALAVSGLPTDRFSFEGFLPRKQGDRLRVLSALADERRTMVFFESPHRLGDSLADVVTALGADRRVVVCRELTKLHEEVRRGTAAELALWAADGVRGEICVVVDGAPERVVDLAAGLAQVQSLVARRLATEGGGGRRRRGHGPVEARPVPGGPRREGAARVATRVGPASRTVPGGRAQDGRRARRSGSHP